jgi:plastocyanin
MTTIERPGTDEVDRRGGRGSSWVTVLAATTAIVAVVDLAFFAVIREVIPPLAVGAVLTGLGIWLLGRRRRAGIAVLGVTSIVNLLGGLGFAVAHLGHPDSGVDWSHSVIGTLGRLVAIGAAVAAWRGASDAVARRTGVIALGSLGLVVVVALVATVATTGDEAEPGDVAVVLDQASFPDPLELDAGSVAFVDNRDLIRHTFTVAGTDLDVDVPARQAVRVPIELDAGTYELVCEIPGHESMTATLTVR